MWVVSFTRRPLYPPPPRVRTSGTYWIGGWEGPRAALNGVEKRKFLTLLGLELRPISRPASSQSLYRLLYPDTYIIQVTTSRVKFFVVSEHIMCRMQWLHTYIDISLYCVSTHTHTCMYIPAYLYTLTLWNWLWILYVYINGSSSLPTCVPVKLNVIKASRTQFLCANSVKYLIITYRLPTLYSQRLKLLPFGMEAKYFYSQTLRTNIVTNYYISIKLQKHWSNFGPVCTDLLHQQIKQISWLQSASELYRPRDRRMAAKLVPNFSG
jgi:hypothetical protein